MLSITKLELNELVLKNEEIDLFKVCNNQINMVSKVVNKGVKVEQIVKQMLKEEEKFGIKDFKTYQNFGKKAEL